MPAFKQSVERWRPYLRAARWYIPAHENVNLANMLVESDGVQGKEAYTNVKYGYTDEEMACGLPEIYRRRCLGLFQCAPSVVRGYNTFKIDPPNVWVTPCEMWGKTRIEDAQKQIEVGLWASQRAWLTSFGSQPFKQDLTDENILMWRLCYHAGPQAYKSQLAKTKAAGLPGTFAGMEKYNPKWGAPDRPFFGARRLLSEYKKAIGQPSAPEVPIDVPAPEPSPAPSEGGGGLVVVLGGALLLAGVAAAAKSRRPAT